MCSLCRLWVNLPMRVKFGVLKQTERIHLQAKFRLNVFIVSPSGGKNPQFWANFDFWGLPYRPLLPMKVKFGMLLQTERLYLHAKFHLNVFIVSPSGGQKPQFWANFEFCFFLGGGRSCTGSRLPIRVKFGVLKQTGRLHLRAKFHL